MSSTAPSPGVIYKKQSGEVVAREFSPPAASWGNPARTPKAKRSSNASSDTNSGNCATQDPKNVHNSSLLFRDDLL